MRKLPRLIKKRIIITAFIFEISFAWKVASNYKLAIGMVHFIFYMLLTLDKVKLGSWKQSTQKKDER